VLLLADAIRRRRRVKTEYRTHAGERSRRELSPHGLVFHAGRWYLAAFDHLRDDLRTFRVDRMRSIVLLPDAADPVPDGFDAVEHVSASLAAVPWGHEVEVVLDLPLEEARHRLPRTLATLTETVQARSFGCRWARSSGWPGSSPASAVTSRSALLTSYGTTSASSRGD
jgi:predicted DNA-binding transcriptional regulator YafY